jgi:hypothetical protein
MLALLLSLLLAPVAIQAQNAQGEIDNCCYLPGRVCYSNNDWVQGWYAFQNGQCQASLSQSFSHSGVSGASVGQPNQDAEEVIDLTSRTISTPRPSIVREVFDAAEDGPVPRLTSEQEDMEPMRRCSSSPKTLWHLFNCAGAS